jgi:hypothetical protein
MSPNSRDYLVAISQLLARDKLENEKRAAQQRQRDVVPYIDENTCLKVLDLARRVFQSGHLDRRV